MLCLNTQNINDVKKLAANVASILRPNDIILLKGTLGAGKTTFAQGIISTLNSKIEEIPSPTFNIILCYDSPLGEIWHFDLYRLKSEEELEDIGFFDAIKTKLCIIEWPEMAEKYIHGNAITVNINIINSDIRNFVIHANEDYLARIKNLYEK